MDWRIVLVIILSVVMIGGFLWLGIAYGRARKREDATKMELEKMRAKWREAVDEITRMVRERKNKELTDEEAADKLRAGIRDYDAHNPSGGGRES